MPFLFFIIWIIAGCSVELQDVGKSPSTAHEAAQSVLFPLSGPHFRILVGEKPNEYSVQIHPPADSTGVMRETADGQNAFRLQAATDSGLKPGGTYIYRFLGSQAAAVIVTLPVDLVVTGSLKGLSADQRFRRVFFSEGSELLTQGQDLRLLAEEIYMAPNSTIRSFHSSDRPAPGVQAKSGGKVEILARQMTGALVIDLQGQSGADGAQGPAYSEPASKGKDLTVGFSFGRQVSECKELKWGPRGSDGLPGRQGLPGGDGGVGGQLQLKVTDLTKASVQFTAEGGLGGRGGLGGPGQLGGDPGRSEYGHTYSGIAQIPCPSLNHGPGATGPEGREGFTGREGAKGSLEINGHPTAW